MGSYDGAETCELIGTYILNEIKNIINKDDIGLYRDDGLAVINKPPKKAVAIKKELCEKFRQLGLQITADANKTVVDFFRDVTFDLKKKEYRPYTKPGNSHLYVHVNSNHPPVITQRIPQSIQARLSNVSSSEEIFKNAKPDYEKALKEAGHRTNMTYTPKCDTNTRQHKRKRKVTWFNPPYSQHVKTKIGEKFLKIVEKNFPKENQLHKICNRNTLRFSYSCMDNMATIIKAHNNTIMNKDNNKPPDTCNCRKKDECPLPGKCTTQNVIYEAKVKTPTEERTYIGLTASSFKTRYTSHKASFTHREKSNHTELSKYIWKLKDKSVPFNLIWSIKKHARPYNPRSKRCNLCLWEKYYIITSDKRTTLNSRSEIISTCRHKRKYLLSEYG